MNTYGRTETDHEPPAPYGGAQGAAHRFAQELGKARYTKSSPEEILGEGGIGRVVVAHETLLRRPVAMKTLLLGDGASESIRHAIGRWLIRTQPIPCNDNPIGNDSYESERSIILDGADQAPWHPLEPLSLARLGPWPDDKTDSATRKSMQIRKQFLAKLTLKRLREAGEKLYGRDTLAKYATWSAKIMDEELHLDAEALEAIAFAIERTPKDRQQALLYLKAGIK